MANVPIETVPLGYGLKFSCAFPDLDKVEVALSFRNHRLLHWLFTDEDPGTPRCHDLGLVRLAFGVASDMFDGEVTWTCTVDVRSSRRSAWRRVFDREHRVLLRFDPSIGEVGGRTEACPPKVDDPKGFGTSQPCTPTVLRFHVDETAREVCKVGSIVKRVMFRDYPPFVFNTVACVGAFDPPGAPGPYTDPDSQQWFNIFLGYYQLDCVKSLWPRPFGYTKPDGSRSVVEPEDLVRLGKSDWNWFSNWCYGVPWDALVATSSIPASINTVVKGPVTIGNRQWHEVTIEGTEVASCYESDAPGAEKLVENSDVREVWQRSFGAPCPRPAYPRSFVPITVDAVVDMAYWEDDEAYHTVIFGGTANVRTDPKFLQLQLDATRAVIRSKYPDLGFP